MISTQLLCRTTVLVCLVVAPGYAERPKQAAPESAGTAQAAPKAEQASEAAKPGVFYDKSLDLYFNYPVEMRTLDMAAEMETGHLNIYGVSGDNDPEHQEAKRCIHGLLDADLPQAKAPQRPASLESLWVGDSNQYTQSHKPQPITAKIMLVEFDRGCVPKKLQKKDDDTLGNMALSAVSLPGIQRMPKPIWYEIGKQKIHMNSGVGQAIVNGQVGEAPVIIMAMATEWRGHLLEWVFTSNDTEIFNEITKSLVRFGDGPWGQMFPANIGPQGSGTPMKILPK